jgi:hypothetical protein
MEIDVVLLTAMNNYALIMILQINSGQNLADCSIEVWLVNMEIGVILYTNKEGIGK